MPPRQKGALKAASSTSSTYAARTTHTVLADQISKILCHREIDDVPQFLVLWRTKKHPLVPPRAICSWHDLDELSQALHFVQAYVEDLPPPGSVSTRNTSLITSANGSASLKRKAPGIDIASRDSASTSNTGLLTPLPSHLSVSRSPSVSSLDITLSGDSEEPHDWRTITVYNGILQRKEGRIFTKKPKFGKVVTVNASTLPTQEMKDHADMAPGPIAAAERLIREAFMEKLRGANGVWLKNTVDRSTPSLDFKFINQLVFGEGVHAMGLDATPGCQECKPNMGGDCGCEYTKLCGCLEYAAVDEQRLKRVDPLQYEEYKLKSAAGHAVDTQGLPKHFPYSKPKAGSVQTLHPFYREQRHAIYECNDNCVCGPNCKTRLVSKGRKVELTIFKTADRGWGVCCTENLVAGEFIDVYLGEVLTYEEADKREERAVVAKDSYLYGLDKFVDDDETLRDNYYVVDGQYMGNATRFINHSCEPNCRQYTVSYNKYDLRVYNLAFFAYEDIPAHTELTFDYQDLDEEEEEDAVRKRQQALNDPKNRGRRPCSCGASKCRGFLWE